MQKLIGIALIAFAVLNLTGGGGSEPGPPPMPEPTVSAEAKAMLFPLTQVHGRYAEVVGAYFAAQADLVERGGCESSSDILDLNSKVGNAYLNRFGLQPNPTVSSALNQAFLKDVGKSSGTLDEARRATAVNLLRRAAWDLGYR